MTKHSFIEPPSVVRGTLLSVMVAKASGTQSWFFRTSVCVLGLVGETRRWKMGMGEYLACDAYYGRKKCCESQRRG